MSNENNVVGYPYSIDVRVALLEASICTINQTLCRMEGNIDKKFEEVNRIGRSDFRLLLSMIVGSAVGITAIMAHGFHWL